MVLLNLADFNICNSSFETRHSEQVTHNSLPEDILTTNTDGKTLLFNSESLFSLMTEDLI